MAESQQMIIKEKIKEYMTAKMGVERSVEEIAAYLRQNNVNIDGPSSALRNALFNLKRENPSLINVRRGIYVWKEEKREETEHTGSKYDFSDFITISDLKKQEKKLMVSVFENGMFTMNSSLLQHFNERQGEIKLKQDGSQLAILKNGKEKVNLGKNGRVKKSEITEELKKLKKKFPVYYAGNWDEQEEIWLGDIVAYNPNKKNMNKKSVK